MNQQEVIAVLDTALDIVNKLDRVQAVAHIGSSTYVGNPNDIDLLVLLPPGVNPVKYTGAMEVDGWGKCGEYDTDSALWAAIRRGNINLIVTCSERFFEGFKTATEVCKALRLEHKQDRIAVCQIVRDGKLASQVMTHVEQEANAVDFDDLFK